MWPHRRQPTRLPHPWDSPGKNTGVGCHFLLQCMKVKSDKEVAQSCPTLRDPTDCSLPGSSVHGIFQARVLEWGAIDFSRCCLEVEVIRSWGGALMKESVPDEKRHERDDLSWRYKDRARRRQCVDQKEDSYQTYNLPALDRGSPRLENSEKHMSAVRATQCVICCYSGLNWLRHTRLTVKHDCHIWSVNLHQRRQE